MAKTIWKYPFPIQDEFQLNMPDKAKVISVQMQGDVPTLWAEVELGDVNNRPYARTFFIVPTGGVIESWMDDYLGTIQVGQYVWHIYQ